MVVAMRTRDPRRHERTLGCHLAAIADSFAFRAHGAHPSLVTALTYDLCSPGLLPSKSQVSHVLKHSSPSGSIYARRAPSRPSTCESNDHVWGTVVHFVPSCPSVIQPASRDTRLPARETCRSMDNDCCAMRALGIHFGPSATVTLQFTNQNPYQQALGNSL